MSPFTLRRVSPGQVFAPTQGPRLALGLSEHSPCKRLLTGDTERAAATIPQSRTGTLPADPPTTPKVGRGSPASSTEEQGQLGEARPSCWTTKSDSEFTLTAADGKGTPTPTPSPAHPSSFGAFASQQ